MKILLAFFLIGFLSFFILLIFLLSKKPKGNDYADQIHPDFQLLRFLNFPFKPDWTKKIANVFCRTVNPFVPMGPNIETIKKSILANDGHQIPIEIYQEKSAAASTNLKPAIMAFHGGGFWLYAYPLYKLLYAKYINGTGAKVIFVDYRLSLNAPYPAAVNDCYEASLWVQKNALDLGIDPQRIALYGDSAGGALSTAVSLMLRDFKQFKPCLQMMIYPLTDDTFSTESAQKFDAVPVWNTAMSRDGFALYMAGHIGAIPPYAYPANAENLSNLPAAYIEVAEFDSLHDEGLAYGKRLEEAGVTVELYDIKGAIHAFEIMLTSTITKKAIANRIEAFNKAFS